MVLKEKTESFLKPTSLKLIILVLILFYGFSAIFPNLIKSPSIFSFIFFFPVIFGLNVNRMLFFLSLIIVVSYSYLVSCFIIFLFNSTNNKKRFWFILLAVLIFLAGIDEPIVNNTINRPDYSCSADSDCVVKLSSRESCGQCVNQEWNYYNSMINRVFATPPCHRRYCSCVQGKCKTIIPRWNSNISDCELLQGSERDECIEIVIRNCELLPESERDECIKLGTQRINSSREIR